MVPGSSEQTRTGQDVPAAATERGHRAGDLGSGRLLIDLAHEVEQSFEVTELLVEVGVGATVEVGAQGW